MKLCSVDWCKWKCYANTYCEKHYARVRKHWSPFVVKKKAWYRVNHYLYRTYCMMKSRVNNPKSFWYKSYWWRWISICDSWLWKKWFDNFVSDMWDKQEWHTLDRINNDLGYCPENCKRSNIYEQARNTTRSNDFVWVSYDRSKQKYVAYINYNWYIKLWTFKTMQEAVIARRSAEENYKIYE